MATKDKRKVCVSCGNNPRRNHTRGDVQSALWIRDIKSARSAKRCICPPGRDKEVAASVSPAESQSGQWRPQVPRHLENVNETSYCTDLTYDPVMASQWCP